jgi:hypothetical protein
MGRRVSQSAIRFDEDTERILEETAKTFNRTRTDVVNAAVFALGRIPLEKRREVLAAYLLRSAGAEPKRARK